MRPDELSLQLRQGEGGFLPARRAVAALSLTAMGSLGLITLYQMGLIRHLPDLPLPGLDADRVDASPEAYARLAMPDAPLGLASYATTLCLAAAGEPDRAAKQPWLPLALAAKVGFDALQAGKLTIDQWTKHRAFCIWCLVAAGATFACVPLVLPEASAAWKQLSEEHAKAAAEPGQQFIPGISERVGATKSASLTEAGSSRSRS